MDGILIATSAYALPTGTSLTVRSGAAVFGTLASASAAAAGIELSGLAPAGTGNAGIAGGGCGTDGDVSQAALTLESRSHALRLLIFPRSHPFSNTSR